jgi:hypothetical protein
MIVDIDPLTVPGSNYVLLTADTLRLLLPQHELGDAEFLEGALEASDRPGLLKRGGGSGPRRYAALSKRMRLLPYCPPERFLAARLGDASDDLSWCWNELRILSNVHLQPQPLPKVLIAPGSPIDQYVEFEGKLAYLCSAQRLRAFALTSGPEEA